MSQTSRTRETETLDSARSALNSFRQICKAWKTPHLSEKAQSRMPQKETLQAFLSPQRLRELAGPKVYARGEKYSDGGAVQLHEHTRDEAIGEVMGSQPYRVGLKLTSKGLVAECTCPAMSDYGFCKHAVALGLHLIGAPPTAKRTIKSRKVVPDDFTERYPNIAGWIKDGWIEIGRDGHSTSTIRVLDEGGLIWEGGTRHRSMDKILQEAEDAISDWMRNN
ncbi:MAG: SWIM zinc finger family protein [Janthinobacterium lividum]